jgi:hypothetical protein
VLTLTALHSTGTRFRLPDLGRELLPLDGPPDGASILVALSSLVLLGVSGITLYTSWLVGVPVSLALATTAIVLVHRVVAASEVVDTEPYAFERMLLEAELRDA